MCTDVCFDFISLDGPCVCVSVQQASQQLISSQLTSPPSPSPSLLSPLRVPGQEAAVVQQGFLHVDAPVLLRAHDVAVVTPPQLHRLVEVGCGALQRETVTAENQLPLGWDELEEDRKSVV